MATVLVVDDTKIIRECIAKLLRFEGFDAVTAGSGAEATRTLDAREPDLVLLDVTMPDVDGLTWLQSVRDLPRWEALPVIMMTGVSDEAAVAKALELGAKEYLVKSRFSVAQMIELLKKHIADAPAA